MDSVKTNNRHVDKLDEITHRQLLAQILDELRRQKQYDVPSDFTHHRMYTLVTGAANAVTIDEISEYGWFYIPDAPRDLTIYHGHARGKLLGTVVAGNSFRCIFPRLDALYIEYGGTGTNVLDIWLSTRPIDVDTFNPAGGGTGGATIAIADNMADPTAEQGISYGMLYDGATWDKERTPTIFKPFGPTAIAVGVGATIWTPAAGKKFRLMGWTISSNVASAFIFGDNAVGTVILRTGAVAANAESLSPDIGNGILSAAANNVLKLDVTAPGNVAGTVFGTEE